MEQTINTLNSRIFRVWPRGMLIKQIAVIMRRLKAPDPTMVPGPSSPDSKLWPTISTHARRISGAEVPRAISVRFATVSFHIFTSMYSGSFPSVVLPEDWLSADWN